MPVFPFYDSILRRGIRTGNSMVDAISKKEGSERFKFSTSIDLDGFNSFMKLGLNKFTELKNNCISIRFLCEEKDPSVS